MNFLFIIAGLVLLILGGNWLLKAAVALSLKLNIPKIVIGMTVVSFATSAPELIVSLKAALNGAPDLALGNVIGSNIANLGFVLGITLLFGAMEIQKSFYKTDWPVMMLASVLLYFFLAGDQVIVRYEGIILFSLLVLFLMYLLRFQKATLEEDLPEDEDALSLFYMLFYLVIGGVGLWAGSELLVKGAKAMAEDFGVSQRIIAVTVVSVGTSIPELSASIIAVIKKEKAISLGNLIGSNIFNILAVLGITSIVTPVAVSDLGLLSNDIFWMLGISFLTLPFVFLPKRFQLNWKHGIVLLVLYGAFIYRTL
ncbi:MAG: calcium/sodium antiporter [Polaribacter sp.]|jgi:cation:H+ antiporter|nr:calcium/sodium antiporter [Polaribacter sp.]MBT4779533.1 calcium/sodium antiporter [Polaribacter sp.]MBT5099003.1 calcium/sodium antiporter [Polaribacter sp.]MBT5645745.1 calcium/sodium antiporter [Polaribacter sp.]MBT7705094.1 calcium/sodium antiporter [Polaribacter sp.]MDA9092293.1 calcium/sodium antiporter [Polaribacter sp.]